MTTRRLAFGPSVLLLATVLAGCGAGAGQKPGSVAQPAPRASEPFNAPAFARGARARNPRLRPGPLLVSHALGVGPVAVDRSYFVAVVGSIEGEDALPKLIQGRLGGGPTTTLAADVQRGYGVASTRNWVAYVPGASQAVVALRHDGSQRTVIARSTVTPIASRGDLIAWAEQDRLRQRVLVRDLESGSQWTAADVPRCVAGSCYRIDAVTLADDGVAFTRGAIGPQPSLVVRRAFTDAKPFAIQVPGDPQPDLAPSSEGVLFNDFARGWFRWDFGSDSPRSLELGSASKQNGVQRLEGNRLLLLSQHGCSSALSVQVGSGRAVRVTSPARLIRLVHARGRHICVQMLGSTWSGDQPVTGWALDPSASAQAHSDKGLGGVAVAG